MTVIVFQAKEKALKLLKYEHLYQMAMNTISEIFNWEKHILKRLLLYFRNFQ